MNEFHDLQQEPQLYDTSTTEEVKESRFADAGKLLAIVAICVAAVPFLNLFFLWYALVPLIVGTIALVKKEPAKGKAILAVLSPIISFVITVVVTILMALIIALSSMNAYESATAPTWEDSVDVSIGSFEINTKDDDAESALKVQVKNISKETKDIVVKIEAEDQNGNRIDTDTLRISDLSVCLDYRHELVHSCFSFGFTLSNINNEQAFVRIDYLFHFLHLPMDY